MDFPSPSQPQSAPVPPQPTPQPVGAVPSFPSPAAVPPQPVQIPVQTHPGGPTGSDDQVYTMPEKFIPANQPSPNPSRRPKKAITIVLIVIIVLAILSIIGGVVFYVLRMMQAEPVVTEAQNAVVVNNVPVTNTNTASVSDGNANANANANSNINRNSNANTNANANVNAVTNANVNVNANANANVNSVVAAPLPGKDTDQDSLTNDEEEIWGTKADLPDTDSDGYNDGIEILAGYDPLNSTSAGRLTSNTALVSTFSNNQYRYSVVYPKNWLAEALTEGDNSEIVITPNALDLAGQFIAITVIDNPTGFTALDWYTDTTNVEESAVVTFTTLAGDTGVLSADGTTAYLANTEHVYAISYRYGSSTELYFPNTFQFIAKSVVLLPSATTNANANTNNANTAGN